MAPMVSVVIPTHNRVDMLMNAVKSVQNQTFHNIEIIVVSDASTDNTETAINEIKKKDDRVKYIRLDTPQGGNVARNRGIEESQGVYIAFLDDDDEWLPEKIELQLKEFEKNESTGLVYSGVHIIYHIEKIEYNTKARDHGDLSKRILIDNCIGTTSCVICKKSILDIVGGFDPELQALQDYDLWIRICQSCDVGIVETELINYNNYTNSKQISGSTERYERAIERINEKYSSLFSKLSTEERNRKNINDYLLLSNKALRNGNPKAGRKYIVNAIKKGCFIKGTVLYFLSFFSYSTILKFRSKA